MAARVDEGVEVLDLETNVWTKLEQAPLHIARNGFGTVVHGDQLFVLGGDDGTMRLTSAECMDISSNVRSIKASRETGSESSSSSSSSSDRNSNGGVGSAIVGRVGNVNGGNAVDSGADSAVSEASATARSQKQLQPLEWKLLENQLSQARNGAAYIVHVPRKMLIAVGGMTRQVKRCCLRLLNTWLRY